MTAPRTTADLPALIAEVRRLLDGVEAEAGGYDPDDPLGFHTRHRAASAAVAKRLMEDHGARISDRWDGARINLGGITATSTIGVAGALQNWLAAAARKLPGEGPR